MPRTLFVVPNSLVPANSGGRIRASAIADALADLGPVTVVALDEVDRTDPWGDLCRGIAARRASLRLRLLDRLVATIRGDPAQLRRAAAAGAKRSFRWLVDDVRPDLVVLSRPCFGPFIEVARSAGAVVVADADESLVRAMGSVARSGAPFRQRVRAASDFLNARRFERDQYVRMDQLWVATAIERSWFETRLRVPVFVVPNRALRADPLVADGAGPIMAIGFVGSYDYAPNEEAALVLIREVMPAIRRVGGPNELVLIGRDPTPTMRRAAAQDGSVRITGTVEDPLPILRSCGVIVVPIRSGAGSRIKILEAMQAGVPVIATTFGIEGIDAVPGRDALVADSAAEIATAVVRLQGDDRAREDLVRAAVAFVQLHHSPAAVRAAVTKALENVTPPSRQT